MPKHVGIVGCSAEGAALCYRTFCTEAPAIMGEYYHPEVSMHTHPLGDYMIPLRKRDWQGIADLMLSSARKLAKCGADFAICPDNTFHEAFDLVEPHSPIPWIHIAEAVAGEARQRGYRCLGILGTLSLMNGPVYSQVLDRSGIQHLVPTGKEAEEVDRIIWKELNYSNFNEKARLYMNQVIAGLKEKGCDAVVLGCTELPILVDPADCPLPPLDSTRLIARAAIKEALRVESH